MITKIHYLKIQRKSITPELCSMCLIESVGTYTAGPLIVFAYLRRPISKMKILRSGGAIFELYSKEYIQLDLFITTPRLGKHTN